MDAWVNGKTPLRFLVHWIPSYLKTDKYYSKPNNLKLFKIYSKQATLLKKTPISHLNNSEYYLKVHIKSLKTSEM